MKKYLFLLVCFGFLMAQCHKEGTSSEATVKGKILEIDSDVPIPNITVKLIELDYDASAWNPPRTVVQKTQSDITGAYQLTYTSVKGRGYEVTAYANSTDYYDNVKTEPVPDGKSNTVNISLIPFGWLKIHVKNVNPVGEEDVITFNYGIFSGRNVDTSIIVKDASSKKNTHQIGINIRKNGTETSKIIEVIIPPHDTTKLDIFY